MRKYLIFSILLIGTLALNAAPTTKSNQLGFRDWLSSGRASSFSLLDPSRMTVQHSLSFSYGSGGNGSLAQSLYLTRLGYKLSDPVTLTFLLGVQNNQYSGKLTLPSNYNSLLGGVALDYRPSRDFHLRLEVLQSPRYLYLSDPGFYPYSSPLLDE